MDIKKQQFNNAPVTKESITHWLKRDIESLYSLAYELLANKPLLESLAEKLHEKHQKMVAIEEEKLKQEIVESEIEAKGYADIS